MKVFLDTNVLVAAFATRGLCEDVLRTVLTEHELLVADTVLEELERVLVQKLRMPANRAAAATGFVRTHAKVLSATEPAPWPERDPADRWIVAAAITGGADVIVTGDRDLLDIAKTVPIAIVSPRGFWERLR
jgi:putative PIN family toxin of toxin-antitoxin system